MIGTTMISGPASGSTVHETEQDEPRRSHLPDQSGVVNLIFYVIHSSLI